MYIWNRVLLGVVGLLSLVMLILGARALKTHQYWRQIALRLEQELKEQQRLRRILLGLAPLEEIQQAREKGLITYTLPEIETAVHDIMLRRGPVWYGCQPRGVDPANGAVRVVVPVPNHQIQPRNVFWVFDERPLNQGGAFLGVFEVAGIGGEENRELQLTPLLSMEPGEIQRLQQSAAAPTMWTLRQLLPPDQPQIFAGLSTAELEQLFPATAFPRPEERQRIISEYEFDGKPLTVEEARLKGLRGIVAATDERGNIVLEEGLPKPLDSGKGIFVRQLRAYESLIGWYHRQRAEWRDRLAVAQRTGNYLKRVTADATLQQQFRQRDVDYFRQEKARETAERDLVASFRQSVEDRLNQDRAEIQRILAENRRMAGELARIQAEAIRAVEARIQQMASAQP
ncbi:MAG: hypothetical protein NZ899_03350 [Thermoguttaceae bacterium]|nr:hypothetical protein [Thermoguttaceae bacterium]MDW8078848.1 hypothetical protein [Thermoguttaceae bacterium]